MSNPILLEDTQMGHGTLLATEGDSGGYLKRWKRRAREVVDRNLIMEEMRDGRVTGDSKKRITDITHYVETPPKKLKGKDTSSVGTSRLNSPDLATTVVPDCRDRRAP
ncbi:hypothetical protein Fot_08629 [Forsythia ovata]|uniref:Uncharacterized protein n=1 Tax=Forsythia ovata TaxID=205694 RepID=A0ABD1WZZ3_9LAMI